MAYTPTHQTELLRRYEIAGLRLLAWLHLGVAVLGIIGAISTARGLLLVSDLLITLFPFGVFVWITLRVEKVGELQRLGLWITLLDGLLLAWLPVSWYLFQGTAPQLLVENDLALIYVLLASIQSITLRPRQPLLVGVVGASTLTGCYFWAVSAGLPPATTDWLVAINTPQVDVSSFWFKALFMVPFGCGALALLAWRGRQLVARSATLERSITALSRYFSPEIVGELITSHNLNTALTGQQREVAVLFVDLAGFTSLSENMSPHDVVALLADYYQRLVTCVFANNGSVDKFLGDGLMATFNMLGDQNQAARQAVMAGLAMMEALKDLNVTRQAQGLTPLRQRIGVHFGQAVVGNVGTSQRMEFTAIGDTVNTASRLQELCKQFQVDFLISAAVYDQFPQVPARDMGQVSVRGKSGAVQVYAVETAP